jgi:hypothetical protein
MVEHLIFLRPQFLTISGIPFESTEIHVTPNIPLLYLSPGLHVLSSLAICHYFDKVKMEDILEAAISERNATFFGEENTKGLISRIEEIMPIESQKYEVVSVKGNDVRFKAIIKTKFLKDEGDIENFVKTYGLKNGETLRITKTKKLPNTRGQYCLMKYFRCQH